MTKTYHNPAREVLKAFKALPLDHPVDMLNLIRLREKADYEDGREATGAEAYSSYGKASAPFFQAVGGRIIWSAASEVVLIGPQDNNWDIAFVARYPTGQAFLDMLYNPDYQAVTHHRTAALADSRLIRMAPREGGGLFG